MMDSASALLFLIDCIHFFVMLSVCKGGTGLSLLEKNLARLHLAQPGSVRALAWLSDGTTLECSGLHDGSREEAVDLLPDTMAVGFAWAIRHVSNRVSLYFPASSAPPSGLIPEFHDGVCWRQIEAEKRACDSASDGRAVHWSFEPLATCSIRVKLEHGSSAPTQMEVCRYLPDAPDQWPARLTEGGLEKELLASGFEPSFASLAQHALSMTPAVVLLGLKEHPREVGITWDGRAIMPCFDPATPLKPHSVDFKENHYGSRHYTLGFEFGDPPAAAADFRDTVKRVLVDGWRPGAVVSGRVRDLEFKQTVFLHYAAPARPALFVRVELTNCSGAATQALLRARITSRKSADACLSAVDGCLTDSGSLLLAPAAMPQECLPDALLLRAELKPGASCVFDFVLPHGRVPLTEAKLYQSARFDEALQAFKDYWDGIVSERMVLDLPEERLNHFYKAIIAQLFANADGDIMPYGSEPSCYAGNLYGVEEGDGILALAEAGFGPDAQRYLEATYLTPVFLKQVPVYKEYADRNRHIRNGLAPVFAVALYRLTRDREWIQRQAPLLRQCAEWTIEARRSAMKLANGVKPLHWGLLPPWSYGGDLAEVECYALYANFACWKGLADTAWLMEELGETDSAQRFQEAAADFRACLDRAVEGTVLREYNPPRLPLQLYARELDPPKIHSDFYNAMAGLMLHTGALMPGSEQERLLTDFLEQDNRLFCLMPRFRRDAGAGGLDGIYVTGLALSKLHQGKVDEFLLAFYGYLAFNLEHDTFAGRETNVIYASDLHARSAYKVPDMSDPVPCSGAMVLRMLRNMLLCEELAAPGSYSGGLLLLPGTPRAWFRDGSKITFAQAPSHFGPVSCEVVSEVARGRIRARVTPPARGNWRNIQLHLRHPEGKLPRCATLNGVAYEKFNAKAETITLLPGSAMFEATFEY